MLSNTSIDTIQTTSCIAFSPMIECKENEDGSLLITWDGDDPVESMLNTWTEEDFIRAIMDEANRILSEHNE